MSGKSSKLSDQEWEDNKDLVRKMYLEDNESLKKVQIKLNEQREGLDVKPHEIESKIKKWNFRKNARKEEWISIHNHITKRKYDGKESEVILCGKRIKPDTVKRETDRHGDKSTLNQLALRTSAPPPLTDCQVAVCTPQPIKMEFEWPATLPWLEFSSRELPTMLQACKLLMLQSQIAPSSDLVSTILPRDFRTDMAHIGVSKLAAIIGRSMPERYPEENLKRAHNLLSGSAEDFEREYVSMIIYNVSNNAFDLSHMNTWEQTMKVLEDCGIFRLDLKLGEYNGPTIDGFMEKLFDASIYRCLVGPPFYGDARAETAVKWLATSGYRPGASAEALWTMLQYLGCRIHGKEQLVLDWTKRLLNAGADANILVSGRGESQTILEIALQQIRDSDELFDLAKLLFNHGASRNLNQALHLAIMREEKDLVEMIVRHGGDLTAGLECSSESPLHKETALTKAAFAGPVQTKHILDLLSRHPHGPGTTIITPDALIAAAIEGHDGVIYSLYEVSPTIMANEYGITPLHMAARYGHLRTCQVLLPLKGVWETWATTKFPPLYAACYGGHKDVVEFLIRSGADADAAPRFDSSAEEERFNRRLNMPYFGSGMTPLDLLLYKLQLLRPGDDVYPSNLLCCAAMLIHAGAKLVGSELSISGIYCHLELLTAGIAAGADPNRVDSEGKTALQCALQGTTGRSDQLYDVVSRLLSYGAQLLGGEVDSAFNLKRYDVAELLMKHDGGNITKTALRKELEKAILSQDNVLVDRLFRIESSIYSAGVLYVAIVMGNDLLIQSLIKNRPAETSEDPLEITAIAVAAMFGNLDLLRKLLARPPSCRAGPLPLIGRANGDGDYVVRSRAEDIRSGNYDELYGSPLALVASSMHPDALKACSYLLACDFCPDKLTWVVAASSNNTAFVQVLLDHGKRGDYTYQDSQYRNPLVYAIRHRNKKMIDLLLGAGVDVSGRGFNAGEPLVIAVARRDLDIVRYLVQAGANVNTNWWMRSPLQEAIGKGDLDIVRYLVEAGANVNAIDNWCRQSPLQEAIEKGDLDFVRYLIQAGADVNAIDNWWGRSPLQKAVEKGELDIVRYLIQAGANVNGPPHETGGATPLQFAAINGHLGLAKYLIDEGAQVNAPPSRYCGRTALQGAAEHGRLDMLEFLLTEGALTKGRWRRHFIKAVKLANMRHHFIAGDLLKRRAGWSEEDEKLLPLVDVVCDADSEGDELDEVATDDTMDSGEMDTSKGE